MSGFGSDDPRQMPPHFSYRALRVDYDRCGAEFSVSAAEQPAWYED